MEQTQKEFPTEFISIFDRMESLCEKKKKFKFFPTQKKYLNIKSQVICSFRALLLKVGYNTILYDFALTQKKLFLFESLNSGKIISKIKLRNPRIVKLENSPILLSNYMHRIKLTGFEGEFSLCFNNETEMEKIFKLLKKMCIQQDISSVYIFLNALGEGAFSTVYHSIKTTGDKKKSFAIKEITKSKILSSHNALVK